MAILTKKYIWGQWFVPIVSAPGRLRRDEQKFMARLENKVRFISQTGEEERREGGRKCGRLHICFSPQKNSKPNFKNYTLFFVIKNPKCTIPMTHAYIWITFFFFFSLSVWSTIIPRFQELQGHWELIVNREMWSHFPSCFAYHFE